MMNLKQKLYRYIIPVFFNLFLFWLLYIWLRKNINIHALFTDIEHINVVSIIFTFIFYLSILFFYAFRLSFLLNTKFKKSLCIVSIGAGFNAILPFRVGDIFRSYFGRRFYPDMEISHTLAATCIERYFDLIILLLFGAVILFSNRFELEISTVYLFAMLLVCSMLSILVYRYLVIQDNFLHRFICRSEKLNLLLTSIEKIFSRSNKLFIFVCSLAIWLSILLGYYLFFKWNLPDHSFSWVGIGFLLFTSTLSFAVPYTIGGVGVFETAVVYYLASYLQILPTKALALALVFHVATALPPVVLMLLVFFIHRPVWFKPTKKVNPDISY